MPVILSFRLEGPLQSWGIKSRWFHRGTAQEPTKSGVIGLISCALGYPQKDPRIGELSRNVRMAVREEHPGTILVDYQTITGGYITAKRTFSKKGIELTKEYLQEASFLVLLEGKRHILEVIHEGFKNPQWPIYLGRKCCIPARPIEPKIKEYDSLMEALETIQLDSTYSNRKSETLRCIIEDPMGSMTRSDEIVASPARIFRKRRVSEIWVSPPEGTS